MMRKRCPECGTLQRIERMDCGCGYVWPVSDKTDSNRDHGRCEWVSDGERCRNPGSCSHSTTGGGPWYCAEHSRCSDPVAGRVIVERSAQSRQDDVQAKAMAWLAEKGIRPSRGMSPAEFAVVCQEYAQHLSQHAPDHSRGNKRWAERLRQREQDGEYLTPTQKSAWRQALHMEGV